MSIYFLLPISYIISYLLGSIPTSVWIGKRFFNKDPRHYGSGNAGATNTLRVLGHKAAIPVLLFDIFKGFAAVYVLYFLIPASQYPYPNYYTYLAIGCGLSAVLGHIYSIFLKFDGGKGVATFAGVALGLSPFALLLCLVIFLTILFVSRYVSLSSMLTAISYPIIITLFYNNSALLYFAILTAITVVTTHHKNIKRLIQRKESKINFKNNTPKPS